MSAPTAPAGRQQDAPQGSQPEAEHPESLRQDTSGRPGDFGLDVRRLRRTRRIVFAILALPILALALLALKFVSMPLTQAWHQGAYAEGDYPAAIERLAPVRTANWFEPYLPHLSEGTDLLQQGDNAAAEAELRVALEAWQNGSDLNQPLHAQCKIINNLAIAIERQAAEIEDPAERADRLYEAEELMAVCAGGGGGGGGEGSGNEDSETTEENGERIEQERREADEEAGQDPDARGEEGEDEGDGDPMDPGDPRQEDPEGDGPTEEATTQGPSEDEAKDDELEQRNEDAQGEGEDEQGGSEEDPAQPW